MMTLDQQREIGGANHTSGLRTVLANDKCDGSLQSDSPFENIFPTYSVGDTGLLLNHVRE